MRLRLSATLLLLSLAMSGCAENSGDVSIGPIGGAQGDVGPKIEGVVTDDSLNPMPDVSVSLDGATSTITDAAGAFEFAGVARGEHTLAASLAGFQDVATVVVLADESVSVRLVMVPMPGLAPFHETKIQNGFMGCGVAFSTPTAQDPSVALCAPFAFAGLNQFDQYTTYWPMGSLRQSSGAIGETEWEPNQASAASMSAQWAHFFPGQNAVNFNSTQGDSPIWIRIPIEDIEAALEEGQPADCTLDECTWACLHFVWAGTLGPSSPVDFTVMVQQTYTDYLTVFYNQPLPEEFSALRDA